MWFRKSKERDTTDLPLYRRRDRFIDESTAALYRTLVAIAGDTFFVFPKVKLSELAEPELETGNTIHQRHWIKVHHQSIDFLLCSSRTMRPVAAVRVYSTIRQPQRTLYGSDIVDTVLRDIGLPVMTLSAQKRYDEDKLKKRLQAVLDQHQGGRETKREGQGEPVSAVQL